MHISFSSNKEWLTHCKHTQKDWARLKPLDLTQNDLSYRMTHCLPLGSWIPLAYTFVPEGTSLKKKKKSSKKAKTERRFCSKKMLACELKSLLGLSKCLLYAAVPYYGLYCVCKGAAVCLKSWVSRTSKKRWTGPWSAKSHPPTLCHVSLIIFAAEECHLLSTHCTESMTWDQL